MIRPTDDGERYELTSATALPNASGFLWNKSMMIHMNCRGYAVAQFMQPEPAKYAHAPNLEAKTFMQPEQPYYAHHPGRFCYVKDEDNGRLFSAPHEPVRAKVDSYKFSVGKSDIRWEVQRNDVQLEMCLTLSADDPIELWAITVKNIGNTSKNLSLYPYFPFGYMSWMNQSGVYDARLNGIIGSSVTPYQKYKDYERIKDLKDKTYLLADVKPSSWEVNQNNFEGEGGLQYPAGISAKSLANGDALYETPAAIFQYRVELKSNAAQTFKFLFGPAKTTKEIEEVRDRYFGRSDAFNEANQAYSKYIDDGKSSIQIKTPDPTLDNFVNHWLSRQIYYHGETNRLSTDPQTRNYLQDNMGMGYIKPDVSRKAYITALSQQKVSGAMPDGILIHDSAELKYINQVPHTDHCVWLPICMKAYLDETNDYDLLKELVPFADSEISATVEEHMELAIQWLLHSRDERGLNFIEQGDWCDPMNGVGPKGKGVSAWLTMATSYAVKVWGEICKSSGNADSYKKFTSISRAINGPINVHMWDKNWYARGITDDNVKFGIMSDAQGSIFLNAQSWALLSDCADDQKVDLLLKEVEERLETPYGVEMLAPSFTTMREDIGRVTQKHPGSAENGSVYNHAAAFYIFGLFAREKSDKAYELLRKMIPGPDKDDLLQRGQLPVFIPNYYRGAYRQFPRTAGRSSQLFNTGTVPWLYRCLIDGLFGINGSIEGLCINPQLPKSWNEAHVIRLFRGATFDISFKRDETVETIQVIVDGTQLEQSTIRNITAKSYKVKVRIPS